MWMCKVSHLCTRFLLLMKPFLDGQLDSLVAMSEIETSVDE